MITVVDPLQPMVSMSWFVQQADQHRRSVPATPGIVGEQPKSDWLSTASALIRFVVRVVKRWVVISFISMLAAVGWLQERAAVHRSHCGNILLFLGGGAS